jgi:hypothetical protein
MTNKPLEQADKLNKIPQLPDIATETLVALLSSKTKTEAAHKLQIDRTTLYNRIDKFGLDKIISEIPRKALQTLMMGSERAAEVLVDELDNKRPDSKKIEAAKDILDRVLPKQNTPQVAVQINQIIGNKKEEYGI